MTRPRVSRDVAVLGAALAAAIIGGAALLAPVSVEQPGIATGAASDFSSPATTPASSPALALAPANEAALVATIVQANIFSDTRRPATARYDVGGMTSYGGASTDPAPPPMANTSLAPPPDENASPAPATAPVPRLFGIVAEADGPVALLRLDSRNAAARPYRVGDRGGSYRVVSIGEREVVLESPAGRRTLRLFTSPDAPTPP